MQINCFRSNLSLLSSHYRTIESFFHRFFHRDRVVSKNIFYQARGYYYLFPMANFTQIKQHDTSPAHSDIVIGRDLSPVSRYNDTSYNRNKTLISHYVNRIIKDFPTPTERYYDIRLLLATDRRSYFGEVGDQCIMFHSNRICLITLAPTHPVILEDKTIDKIEFSFEGHEKIDRLLNQPKGKRKRGGHKLKKFSPVCAITCSDGIKYVITAGISSKLIEINELISNNFDLIKKRPLSEGFIAIVQPQNWRNLEDVKSNLLKLDDNARTISMEDSGD